MVDVLLVQLETKYRDIADGNNLVAGDGNWPAPMLETKYRDIADGNRDSSRWLTFGTTSWKPSTAI